MVVAVSCNPTTFARDAKILMRRRLPADAVTPVDQFRYSMHVESGGEIRALTLARAVNYSPVRPSDIATSARRSVQEMRGRPPTPE